jgi:hypothetical protein
MRKRPSPIELETARRALLVQSGRIVDGTFLDVADVEAEDGRMLTMLFFQYRIGGVDYTCSQDITELHALIDLSQVRSGFPCSIRYERGNPQNSIVVAEQWSGLRGSHSLVPIPKPPAIEDLDPADLGHLRPGRG